jgi:hypothetical protein
MVLHLRDDMNNIRLTMNPDGYELQAIWDVEFWFDGERVVDLGAWIEHVGWFTVESTI